MFYPSDYKKENYPRKESSLIMGRFDINRKNKKKISVLSPCNYYK